MNIHTAYTIYNNDIQSVEPQLAEAIDRIIDAKSKAVDRYKECYEICERGMHRAHDLYKATQEKLDQVELAEAKARIEIEAIDAYYSALLKKRVQQLQSLGIEIEQSQEVLNAIKDFSEEYAPFNSAMAKIQKMAEEGLQ